MLPLWNAEDRIRILKLAEAVTGLIAAAEITTRAVNFNISTIRTSTVREKGGLGHVKALANGRREESRQVISVDTQGD